VAEEKVPPRTVKIVDKRRFTTEGEPRDDVPRETGPTPEGVPSPPPNAEPPREAEPPESAPDASSRVGQGDPDSSPHTKEPAVTSPEFVELIVTLAQQAELLIVGAEGVSAEPDQARRIIDYLVALESKTAGNVSSEEQQILSNVVFQLRSLFLQRR